MINTTTLTNGTGNMLVDATTTINTASGGLFGLFFLIAVYVLVYISTARFGTKVALSTSGFIGVVVALLSRTIGIINDQTLIFAIVILIIAALVAYNSKD